MININPSDKKAKEKLKLDIQMSGDIPDKQWLLDRVQEL